VVQKISNGREASKPASTSAASRAAEPVEPSAEETKKSAFKKLRLAAPTVKGGKTQDFSNAAEPGIAMDSGAGATTGALNNLGGGNGSAPTVPVPVGGDVSSAQLISTVPPAYPQIAKSQRLSGDVKIDALIDEHGRVTGMKVVSGPVMLQQAAMDALKQWKYKPATLNGNPVSMHLLVTIQFRLK
jgi:protein TonB